MTRKELEANYKRYQNSSMYSLYDAYGRPSQKKYDAWKRCEVFCKECGGESLKVISYNTYVFTAGFVFVKDGKRMFMLITPSTNREIEVE